MVQYRLDVLHDIANLSQFEKTTFNCFTLPCRNSNVVCNVKTISNYEILDSNNFKTSPKIQMQKRTWLENCRNNFLSN